MPRYFPEERLSLERVPGTNSRHSVCVIRDVDGNFQVTTNPNNAVELDCVGLLSLANKLIAAASQIQIERSL